MTLRPDLTLENVCNRIVSRETIGRLERYTALLAEWQKAINLVSPATIPDAWARHILDSGQLSPLLPTGTQTLFDFGSGAGFPGLVLAMLHPEISVHLVESDQRKCGFLSHVSRETSTPVTVHNERIEALSPQQCDVITARALAPLESLLNYAAPWAKLNPNLTLLLPKGVRAEEEILAAKLGPETQCAAIQSRTDPGARILKLTGL